MPPTDSQRLASRRLFLQAGTAAACALSAPASFAAKGLNAPFKLGLIADLHYGLEPTAGLRLETFMRAVETSSPDAILQLGDFNFGDNASHACTELWNTFSGPKYHVLGNHDMDRHGKSHMVQQWEMPGPYYSFNRGGIHFVCIDRNSLRTQEGFVAYDRANFYVDASMRGFADPEQLDWLRDDLVNNTLPTVIFSHQGLGVREPGQPPHPAAAQLETLFAEHNHNASQGKIVACFCGHHHVDRYQFRDDIHYVWINSISYYWVGSKYGRMAPYQDPLFCFLTFMPTGDIVIDGASTTWAAPSPQERGYPNPEQLNTYIKDRQLQAGRKLKASQ